jgi:dimethylamine/trimethylamine dehydrogenase
MISSRLPDTALYDALIAADIGSVTRIGDCLNPGLIAAAVHSGHRYARELNAAPAADLPFRVEQIAHESRTA